eukprot:scaffold27210_cov66-Phaeocystis_antarctica.AAC.3
MPLNAAIQRIQRLMGFNGVLTDGVGGSAQTDLSNLVGPRLNLSPCGRPRRKSLQRATERLSVP